MSENENIEQPPATKPEGVGAEPQIQVMDRATLKAAAMQRILEYYAQLSDEEKKEFRHGVATETLTVEGGKSWADLNELEQEALHDAVAPKAPAPREPNTNRCKFVGTDGQPCNIFVSIPHSHA